MSSDRETPSKPGSTPSPAPFVRVQAQWGKPPPVIFRAGPLPKSADLSWAQPPAGMRSPASAQQQRQSASQPAPQARSGGILSGSMVPPPRPAAAEPAHAPASEPVPEPVAAPIAPPVPAPVIDITVRPLPPGPQAVAEPEPQRAPEPSQPPAPRITPADLKPAELAPVQTALGQTALGQTAPAAPVYATASPKPPSRLPLYLGLALAAAAAVAGGIWLAGRGSAPAPMAPLLPTTGVAADTVLDATPLSPEPAPAVVQPPAVEAVAPNPAPKTTATPPAATTRPASVPAARPATQPSSAPSPTQSLNRQPAQAPVIETQPLAIPPAGPQPTAAQPAAADPDAPIETRPQPLN